ncbi:MAG: arsenite methyltransferase [Chitinophagaceae bacterium]|jgi:SAM-dependent methyltransferase|nr:arsenite methyltransferase [Chitinophagaceae bacterium]
MNTTDKDLKALVKEKYSQIAQQDKAYNAASCCGATNCCGGDEVYNIMADDYTQLDGYHADADLGLGCGIPTAFARLQPGYTVVDLGSGAGNDAFVARRHVGPEGKVIGVDFSEAMIEKARQNADKLGYNNVEFRQGDIEQLPLSANRADVVLSNCVLNLVPNKAAVFAEIFRVLKPGGHFSISDIVLDGELPGRWQEVAELYAGCVSGAIQKSEYLHIIRHTGFTQLTVQKEKAIVIPDELLQEYLTADEIAAYKASQTRILSVTVYAEKPASACQPGSGCC